MWGNVSPYILCVHDKDSLPRFRQDQEVIIFIILFRIYEKRKSYSYIKLEMF
jgi:hypothetical protein